jgi:hypothetical protein
MFWALMVPLVSRTLEAQSVLTWHNDNSRTGQNLNETILTLSNVNATQFGKKFTRSVDGRIYAQPLYVPNVSVPSKGTHNVVYVATENDSVYAFDGDGTPATPLWHRGFTNPAKGITAVPCADTPNCGPVGPVAGITGTPVIDSTSKTLYVVVFTKENGSYFQRFHALDITTGAEKFAGPVVIQASVPGTGVGSVGGTITFDPRLHNQRAGLLLSNGVVYIAWASFGDLGNYHGWVLGYNATTLKLEAVFNDTPNGRQGGIWQSGGGLSAAPGESAVFLQTGNGTFDANLTGGLDYGDSFLRLSTTGGFFVADYFTPDNQSTLDDLDLDLGSGAGLIPPTQSGPFPHEIISAGKDGIIYVVNRDNMGKFNSSRNNVIQTVIGSVDGYYRSPAYFHNAVYYSGWADFLDRYTLTNGLLSALPVSESPTKLTHGSTPSISANGTTNGIVWALEHISLTSSVLHAYDASDVSKELYNSSQKGTRDSIVGSNLSVPTIANGKVYVGTFSGLAVYGIL